MCGVVHKLQQGTCSCDGRAPGQALIEGCQMLLHTLGHAFQLGLHRSACRSPKMSGSALSSSSKMGVNTQVAGDVQWSTVMWDESTVWLEVMQLLFA